MKSAFTQHLPYSFIATYYDKIMNKNKYLQWKKLISRIVRKYRIEKLNVLDLACGTGEISRILFDMGFEKVIGVDKSKEMLRKAREKCPDIRFIQQDISNLKIDDKFDLVVSFYDSLNYLISDRQMISMFKGVFSHLKPKGVFLFDVNTREHVKVFQKRDPQIVEHPDCIAIFKSGGRKRLWELQIDLFTTNDGKLYKRDIENHVERGYDENDMVKILKKTRFKILETITEEKEYNGKKYKSRLYFLVQRVS